MARTANLFAGVIVEASAPRAMLAGTHYDLVYDTESSELVFDWIADPVADNGIATYVVRPHQSDPDILIPKDGPFPWRTFFDPVTHPRAWRGKDGLVQWDATPEVGAKDTLGTLGLLRATTVTINTTGFLTIPAADWSAVEIVDSEAAGGVVGKVTITVSENAIVPVGLELRAGANIAAYNSANLAFYHNVDASPLVEPGGSVTIATGGAEDDTVCNVLLFHEPETGLWLRASQNLLFLILEGFEDTTLPSFTVPPAISGTGKIGSALTLSFSGSDYDTATIEWLRGGVTIEGETGNSYTPAAADDLQTIEAKVVLENEAGTVELISNGVQVTYNAPQTSGSISNLTTDEEDGASLQFSAASAFNATPGAYTVSPPFSVVSIDATDGDYSVDIDEPLAATQFTIIKSNSGGSAQQSFTITIDVADPVITRPSPEPTTSDVTVTEVTDPDEAENDVGEPGVNGNLKWVTSGFSNFAPSGFTCRIFPFDPSGPGTALVASSTDYSSGGRAVGSTVTPSVQWVHTASGQRFHIFDCPPILIQGLDADPPPEGDFPLVPTSILNTAKTATLVKYGIDNISGGLDSGFSMVLVAYGAFTGDTSCDARLLQIMRHWCNGSNSPCGASGYAQQHEDHAMAVIAIASKIPRVWNALTASERTKLDLCLKICAVAACAISSESRPRAGTLIGRPNNLSGNINFSLSYPCGITCAMAYFGSAAALLSFLDGFSKASFRSACVAQGLTNIVNNMDRWDWSASQVETALNNPTFAFGSTSFSYSNVMGIYTANQGIPRAFNGTILPGATANNGTGGGVRMPNGSIRGIIAGGAGGLPNRGQTGQCQEFQGSDANENNGPSNVRSSYRYVFHGTAMVLTWIIVGMVSGLINRSNSTFQNTILPRMRLGMNDLSYKNTQGYNSYAHGGSGSGNENWRASNQGTSVQFQVVMSAFDDVIDPWLDAG